MVLVAATSDDFLDRVQQLGTARTRARPASNSRSSWVRRSNSLLRSAVSAHYERSAPMPLPTAVAPSRSLTTSCSNIACASKRRPPQAARNSASASRSSIARHTHADAKVDTPATSAAARTNLICDAPVRSAISRSFSGGSKPRPPQPRPRPGPHDRDGFEPVGALDLKTSSGSWTQRWEVPSDQRLRNQNEVGAGEGSVTRSCCG